MQRQICWVERQEDGIRRETRVTIHRDKVKWQFKAETDERWDYKTPPTVDEWESLLTRVEHRYQRRVATHADLLLVRRLCGEVRTAG